MRLRSVLAGACCAALSLSAVHAQADAITFTNFAEANGNDSNFDGVWDSFWQTGPLVNLLAYNGTAAYIGGTNDYDIRGAMEFDVRALPSYATITSATLKLHYEGASGASAKTLQFNGYLGDGAIQLSDFTAGTMVGGTRYNSFGPGSGVNNYYSIPVTDLVQQVVTTGNGYAGFTMFNVVSNQTSLGGSLSNNAPSLVVTYSVPEPATLSVLGLGGLLLGRRRRA